MVISKELDVTPEELFGVLRASAVSDVASALGKKEENVHLKSGYSYKKELTPRKGRSETSNVKIVRFEEPTAYEVKIDSPRGTYHMAWDLKPTEKGTLVTYTDEVAYVRRRLDFNASMNRLLYDRGAKKRARGLFRSMVAYIKANREV